MVFGKSVKLADEQTSKKVNVKQAANTVTDDAQLEGDKRRRKREKKQALYTSLFWGVISLFLLALSISLIAIGALNDLQDLIILGSIFLVAGVGFLILLFVLVCKPMITRWVNRVTPAHSGDQNKSEFISKEDVEKQRRPTAFQLYGEDKIIHVPNPKELSDLEFPLPPMVYHPNNTVDEHIAVVQLPLTDKAGSEPHDTPDIS